ncbi:MAG: 4Fe-4S dicluster domain-containing protein [Candidatus Aureabacteria bacterium]|nr:4Fe-4S dicluster domain-containing protein [Candidatus Auribacterota bacterium]
MVNIFLHSQTCKGCKICVAECPAGVLEMSDKQNEIGAFLPEVKRLDLCTGCTRCAVVCPECSIEIESEK